MREASGITRDVSNRGTFIEAAVVPPVGARLELSMHVPPISATQRQVVQLIGEGMVLRTEAPGTPEAGFAAEVMLHNESCSYNLAILPSEMQ